MERPIIVDCNNLCHIQLHALGTELSWQDVQTGVMWGFFNSMLRIAREFVSGKFIFCWDSRHSLRKELYPEYKSNRNMERDEDDKAMFAQFTKLRRDLLPDIGFRNIYQRKGLEADDLIAVLVGLLYDAGAYPLVVSTDHDLYQLLDMCDIHRPLAGKRKGTITREELVKRYGVRPDQWVAVRALQGDVSDAIPGVNGVGEKTAIKFVRGELPVGSAARKNIAVASGFGIVHRNEQLMHLPYELAGDVRLPYPMPEHISLDEFIRVCNQYGFRHFLKPDILAQWRESFHMR